MTGERRANTPPQHWRGTSGGPAFARMSGGAYAGVPAIPGRSLGSRRQAGASTGELLRTRRAAGNPAERRRSAHAHCDRGTAAHHRRIADVGRGPDRDGVVDVSRIAGARPFGPVLARPLAGAVVPELERADLVGTGGLQRSGD